MFSYEVGGYLYYMHDCNKHTRIKIAVLHITESQNGRGWKVPLGII